jgi:hypothetical protein
VTWRALRIRGIHDSLFAGPNAWLKQLVLLFTIACLLTCAYLWQSSAIAAIQKDTRRAETESIELERANVALMVQVAQWNSPAYIKEKARQGKLTPASDGLNRPQVIEVPMAPAAGASLSGLDWAAADPAVAVVASTRAAILWRQLTAQLAALADAGVAFMGVDATTAQAAARIR